MCNFSVHLNFFVNKFPDFFLFYIDVSHFSKMFLCLINEKLEKVECYNSYPSPFSTTKSTMEVWEKMKHC